MQPCPALKALLATESSRAPLKISAHEAKLYAVL
jgi:hypothetical protein